MTEDSCKNKEYFIKYESEEQLPKRAYLDELKDTLYEFNVTLTCSERAHRIEISMNSPFTVRCTDKENRLKLLKKFPKEILEETILIQVKNSEYIDWFMNESLHIYDDMELNHFIIISDEIIDILTEDEPQIFIEKIKR